MAAEPSRNLTQRQRAVLEAIDRRQPIKVIAGELGVSESRINQHIKALKDIYGVASLPELVEWYRSEAGYEPQSPEQSSMQLPDQAPCRKPAYINSQLPDDGDLDQKRSRVGPGEIVLSDAHHVLIDVPWSGSREPVVVPAALDGDNAVLYRLAVMIGIAFGTIALVVLVITASLSLSTAMDGVGEIARMEHNAGPG
ncbi:helix-turn-helix transcriptional regulator [Parerythrobacter lacustris]|uniref:LuxR C-terminal-related transcriptional regulator n=1 Tax=Parerythrobacter lacustris TaxID=2969984 RepID=A0ABT1XNC0_9SPHN|nr:LuxR C-terminal-related transcriptional regulator [Parerythrobacter lacustris]MCR2832747.1 LuxR C-terminal-related transcriptional regulator [Parerythrobacter lacustris]